MPSPTRTPVFPFHAAQVGEVAQALRESQQDNFGESYEQQARQALTALARVLRVERCDGPDPGSYLVRGVTAWYEVDRPDPSSCSHSWELGDLADRCGRCGAER